MGIFSAEHNTGNSSVFQTMFEAIIKRGKARSIECFVRKQHLAFIPLPANSLSAPFTLVLVTLMGREDEYNVSMSRQNYPEIKFSVFTETVFVFIF